MASSNQESIHISDDEVFRRKLLMDGDGMGDDRRLNNLLKNFFMWCDAKGHTDEQIVAEYQGLMSTLAHCELQMTKSKQAQAANERELQNYENLESEIEKKIARVQETILEKKAELKKAKKMREHKMQYDALGKLIAELPDRKETEAKLKELNDEINSLDISNQKLETKLETRHKELKVLLSSAAHLKEELKGEEASSESD